MRICFTKFIHNKCKGKTHYCAYFSIFETSLFPTQTLINAQKPEMMMFDINTTGGHRSKLQLHERVSVFCQIRQSGLEVSSIQADHVFQSLKPTFFDHTFCSTHRAHLSLWFLKMTQNKVKAAHDKAAGVWARKKEVAEALYSLSLTVLTKLPQEGKGSFLSNQNQWLVLTKLPPSQHLPQLSNHLKVHFTRSEETKAVCGHHSSCRKLPQTNCKQHIYQWQSAQSLLAPGTLPSESCNRNSAMSLSKGLISKLICSLKPVVALTRLQHEAE